VPISSAIFKIGHIYGKADQQAALEEGLCDNDNKFNCYYREIGDCVIELDGDIRERIKTLKQERDIIEASIEGMAEQLK